MTNKDFQYWLKKAMSMQKTATTIPVSLAEYKRNATTELQTIADALPPKRNETARDF